MFTRRKQSMNVSGPLRVKADQLDVLLPKRGASAMHKSPVSALFAQRRSVREKP